MLDYFKTICVGAFILTLASFIALGAVWLWIAAPTVLILGLIVSILWGLGIVFK